VKLNDNSEVTGYIYFGSYNTEYKKEKESFTEYAKREMKSLIKIYKEIKTIEIRSNYQLDFAFTENFEEIKLAEILTINLIDKLEYPAGQRLIKVSEKEYNLIKPDLVDQGSIYNERLAENCSFKLLCWTKISNFEEIKNEIALKIKELVDNNNFNEVYKFVETRKIELTEKGILLFQSCSAL
jgi:hypothetical protein